MDINHVIFALKNAIFRPSAVGTYKSLLKSERLPLEALRRLNLKKRIALLQHAFEYSPFYRTFYQRHNFDPSKVKTDEDWTNVPILTKDDLRSGGDRIRCENVPAKYARVSTTGGSTGKPVKVYHDTRFPVETLGWRVLNWWGIKPSDDAAFCWRLTRRSAFSRALNKAIWWPTVRTFLDASQMDDKRISAFVKLFNKKRPQYLQGYSGALFQLARFVRENDIILHVPKAVWVTSSPTPAPNLRYMEEVFRAPIYDQYGCCEVFWLAAQCKARRGLHFFYDCRHIEFVTPAGIPTGSEVGDVILTDLENYVFPLIRYRNEDRGRWLSGEQCTCGSSLPLIDTIKGRVTDLIHSPEGGAIAGDYLTTIFDNDPDLVKTFQVIQGSDYSILVNVVLAKADDTTEARLKVVKKALANVVRGASVDIIPVDEINHSAGKQRFIISNVTK